LTLQTGIRSKSVITLLKNYYPSQQTDRPPKISKYAFGKDYHEVIRNKLTELIELIKINIGEIHGRGFVDSAPVLKEHGRKKAAWVGLVKMEILSPNKAVHFILLLHLSLILN
jgi:epoxyqueuosine reductase